MSRRKAPRRYLVTKRTKQSVCLAGVYINLAALARGEGLKRTHVWRTLTGERCCSTPYLRKIADALEMDLEPLLDAIDENRRLRADLKAAHAPILTAPPAA